MADEVDRMIIEIAGREDPSLRKTLEEAKRKLVTLVQGTEEYKKTLNQVVSLLAKIREHEEAVAASFAEATAATKQQSAELYNLGAAVELVYNKETNLVEVVQKKVAVSKEETAALKVTMASQALQTMARMESMRAIAQETMTEKTLQDAYKRGILTRKEMKDAIASGKTALDAMIDAERNGVITTNDLYRMIALAANKKEEDVTRAVEEGTKSRLLRYTQERMAQEQLATAGKAAMAARMAVMKEEYQEELRLQILSTEIAKARFQSEQDRAKAGVAAMQQRMVLMKQQYADEQAQEAARTKRMNDLHKEAVQNEKWRLQQIRDTSKLSLMTKKELSAAMEKMHEAAIKEDRKRTRDAETNARKREEAARRETASIKKQAAETMAAFRGVVGIGGSVRSSLLNIANAFRALAFSMTVRTLIHWGVEYNRIINTLSAATGNLHRAAEEWAYLGEFARKYSLDLFAVSTEYSKFLAAVKGTALSGEPARKVFEGVSKATLVLGLSADRTERAFLALSQMASQTYVTAENLRQQFAEHIPGAMILAARAMEMTNEQFYKALYAGRVLATDLIPKLAAQLEEIYGPHAERAASSMIGSVNRLKTAWESAWAAMAATAPGKALQDILQKLTDLLTEVQKSPAKIEQMSNAFSSAAKVFIALWGGQKMIAGLVSVWNWMKKIRVLAMAGTAGPIALGGLAGAIGGVAVAGYIDKRVEDIQSLDNAVRDAKTGVNALNAELDRLDAIDKRGTDKGLAPIAMGTKLATLEPIIADLNANFRLAKDLLESDSLKGTEAALKMGEKLAGIMEIVGSSASATKMANGYAGVIPHLRKGTEELQLQVDAVNKMIGPMRIIAEDEERIAEVTETQVSHAKELREAYWDMVRARADNAMKAALENKDWVKAKTIAQDITNIEIAKFMEVNKLSEKKDQWVGKELAQKLELIALTTKNAEMERIALAMLKDYNDEVDKRLAKEKKINDELERQAKKIDEAVAQAAAELANLRAKHDLFDETPLEGGIRRANEELRILKAATIDLYETMNDEGKASTDAMYENFRKMRAEAEAIKIATDEWQKSMAGGMLELWDEALRDTQNAFADFFSSILEDGKFTWEGLVDSMKNLFIKLLADMLAFWITHEALKTLETAKAAAERAYIESALQGGSDSQSGAASWQAYWSAIKKAWQAWTGGGTAAGAAGAYGSGSAGFGGGFGGMAGGFYNTGAGAAAGSAAGTGGVAASTTGGATYITYGYGAGGMGPPTSAAAGSAASTAAIYAAVIVVAAMVIKKMQADRAEKKMYQTAAGASFNQDTGTIVGGWAGRLDKTGAMVAAGITNLMTSLVDASGGMMTGMKDASVRIRNDKKKFDAYVGDLWVGSFDTAKEAIVAAAKRAFSTATFSQAIDPIFQDMVSSFEGIDPEALAQAAGLAQGILEASSGMSEMGKQVQQLIPSIHGMNQQLLDLGVSMESAAMLTAKFAMTAFQNLFDQFNQTKKNPKEELERYKQDAKLALLQRDLYLVEVQGRILKLKSDITLAKAEIELNRASLEAEHGYLKGRAMILEADAELSNQKLNLGKAELIAKAKIMEKELEILLQLEKFLGELHIDIEHLQLPGTPGGPKPPKPEKPPTIPKPHGGAAGGGKSAVQSVLEEIRDLQKELVLSSKNPAGVLSQLSAAREQFEKLKAFWDTGQKKKAAGIKEAGLQYLELYGQAYGTSGAGYAELWKMMNDWSSNVLRKNGMTPLGSFANAKAQVDYGTKEFSKTFKRDSSGNLTTYDAEVRKHSEATSKKTDIVIDRLEELIDTTVASRSVPLEQNKTAGVRGRRVA